jgi:excisionase family DNA binding protein
VTVVLTLDQVAERLQVSRRTINRLVAQGRIRTIKVGQQPRVTEREFEAFIASARRGA